MKKSYLDAYYPDGMSAEDRLFKQGEWCTRVQLRTWFAIFGICIGVAIFGTLLMFVGDFIGAVGVIIFSLADIGITIATGGICVYLAGLYFLERAELLYNTRLAGREDKEDAESASVPGQNTYTGKGVNNWTCTCGKTNANYVLSCSCGVTKDEAKQGKRAVPIGGAPVRTPNGWRCSCGKEHPAYVSSCNCGVNKSDIK